MGILIIGSDSVIGAAVFGFLQSKGFEVWGTSRRHERIKERYLYCDLNHPVFPWETRFDNVVFCAGISSQLECEKNPVATAEINVRGTLKLAKLFAERGSHIIFLSSDKVFNGTEPVVRADAPYSPICEYGRQKVEAEKGFRALDACILRLSKVLGPIFSLFSSWTESWGKGLPIEAFTDLYFSPIPLEVVIFLLSRLIEDRARGIYQLSAEADISYYEAAKIGVNVLGVSERQIRAVPIPNSLKTFLRPNVRTTLDTSLLKNQYQLDIPSPYDTIKEIFLYGIRIKNS
jgi:dTDP-4-dehydrorhamnose reductase